MTEILEINKPYPIIYATSLERDTGSTLLVVIQKEINDIVMIYLPEIGNRETQDNLIITINTGSEKYRLIFKGRFEGLSHMFHLEPV